VNALVSTRSEQPAPSLLVVSGKALKGLLERVPFGRAPNPPPSPWERLERWRRLYNALSVEQQLGIEDGKTTKQEINYHAL
jgi:hypothetical protein